MFHKVSKRIINEVTDEHIASMTDNDRDEMAIPTYLHYNPIVNWIMWQRYHSIYDMSYFHDKMEVLEFGCGVGLFLPTLVANCGVVHAVDIFPDFAKRLCNKYQLSILFHQEVTEIADASLDLIIAADVLEHVDDIAGYLRTFRAKLKRTGSLIVSGPTENSVYRIGRILAGFSGKGEYHHTDINHLLEEINCNGFSVKQSQNLPFPFAPCLFKVARFTVTELASSPYN